MYRVIFDFGEVEVSVMQKSKKLYADEIRDEAIQTLIDGNFSLPSEQSMVSVEPAPEWLEE